MLNMKLCKTASRRTLVSLSSIHNPVHHSSSTNLINPARSRLIDGFEVPKISRSGFVVFGSMRFHSGSRVLGFRASNVMSQNEPAMADYYEVDRASQSEDGLEISRIGISEEIVSSLAKKGITKLFPIQKAVLEPAMQGRDMIGRARTGTGKTLAFGIPIMDKIIQCNKKHGKGRNPLALVMAPTRELARQVEKEFHESAPSLDLICTYGGTPISIQMRQLDNGVDIVVGTPGRIIDLLKRGSLNLSEIQFIVLDEADQMLNVGFEEAVESILEKLPQKRQSLMFSATMPTWIKKLTTKYLNDPLTIDLVGDSDQKLAEGISLYSIASDMYGKASIIGPLIAEHAKGGKSIVFTQTKRDADRLAYALGRSLKCEALHGDINQNQRERTLSGFRDGYFNVLVATDVAARGLDVPNVDLVIHYELPNNTENFVHRSGRTGRAGKKGSAIVIYTDEQTRTLRSIEREVNCKFTELPKIAAEGGIQDMIGGHSQFSSYNSLGSSRFGQPSFGRSDAYSSSGYTRPSAYSNSSPFRSNGYGNSRYGQTGGYDNSGYGQTSGYGNSGYSRPNGYGSSSSGQTAGYGNSGYSRPSGYNNSSPGPTGGYGNSGYSQSGGYGNSGYSRPNGYGSSSSGQIAGYGNTGYSRPSGYNNSSPGPTGGYGNSGYSKSGGSGNPSPGQMGGYGNPSPGYNNSGSSQTDVFGSGQSSGSAEFGSSSGAGRFGSFGDT